MFANASSEVASDSLILAPPCVFMTGPDTASLAIRCGLHSGPVTAGVLRGEKSRFQLL